jgi:streptomycin 6-kinase
VLKLVPPSAAEYAARAEQEAAALRAWAGRGAVSLWEFAPDLGALLMERVMPGTSLEDEDESSALQHVADVFGRLSEASIPAVDLLPLAKAIDRYLAAKMAFVTDSERRALGIPKARGSAQRLAGDSIDEVLLHGDLMDKNLLRADGGYLAIDPIPCIGDVHSDIGFWAATRVPAQSLDRRAAALAELVGLDPGRAARWAAVYAVGQACETWRPDIGSLREWVRSHRAQQLLRA